MASTDRHGFLLWAAGFTQSDIFLNDLLLKLEVKLGLSVVSRTTTAQPGSPTNGDCYIIPGSATGAAWSTFAEHDVAIFRDSTWYAFTPILGWLAMVEDESNALIKWDGSAWTALTASTPLTTKGDLLGYDTSDARVPVGSDGQVLEADSGQALGLKWAAKESTKYIGQNLQTDDYTLVLSDAGKVVEIAHADPKTLTIPANASVAFPVDTVIKLVQGGAGDVTIGITDDTLNGATSISAEWGSVLLWKRAATEWVATVVDPSGLSESEVDARVVEVAPTVATSRTVEVTIPDDGVWEYEFSGAVSAGNIIVSTSSSAQHRGIFSFRANTGPRCDEIAATLITATTGALTGTTGVNGEITVSAASDNKIYVENRSGFQHAFAITINTPIL